jgi:ankyrin repeat protein
VEVARILIERNAHINAKDIIGRTPLFHATKLSNLKIVKMLLAAKADPLLRTMAGKIAYSVSKNN